MIRTAPLALLAGCAIPVDVGPLDGSSTGDIGATTTSETLEPSSSIGVESSSTGDTDGIVERRDLAFRFGDLPPVGGDTTDGGSSVGTSGGSDIDPDAILINVGIGETTCDDPYGGVPFCGERWEVSFILPPELQFAGAQGDVFDNFGVSIVAGPGSGSAGDDCFGGGGSIAGTFEITGFDDAEVRGTMTLTDVTDDFVPTSIEFAALRCG